MNISELMRGVCDKCGVKYSDISATGELVSVWGTDHKIFMIAWLNPDLHMLYIGLADDTQEVFEFDINNPNMFDNINTMLASHK